jgi:hypothetical protein
VALGFKLSGVVQMDVLIERKIIRFITKTVVYELVFDDQEKIDKITEYLKNMKIEEEKKAQKPRKKFYLEANGEPQ